MLFGVYEDERFKEQICYIFSLFFSVYGIEWEAVSYTDLARRRVTEADIVISYGRKGTGKAFPHQIHIYASPLFSSDYLKLSSMPRQPLAYYGDLPIIYQGETPVESHMRRENDIAQTDIDVIASSFFMLTRYEEVVLPEQDEFGRFPGTASLAFREGFLHRPVVNEYIDLLWDWIKGFDRGLVRRELWEGRDFAVCLTVDVDRVSKYGRWPPLRGLASLIVKHRRPQDCLALIQDYIRAKVRSDPFNTFEYLMRVAERHGFPVTFYFMSGGETDYDNGYPADNARIASLARMIRERGNEIGLHSSFNAYRDLQMLKKEKQLLEHVQGGHICGVRQHYLRWKTPDSWQAREEAGFAYDATITFADREGFRSGICFPYKPFDVVANRTMDIWEIPTVAMDRSLFTYQKLTSESARQRIAYLIDEVKKWKGVFVLLWHNSSFDELRRAAAKSVYEEVLSYLGSQNVFSDTMQGILRLWATYAGYRL